MLTTTRDMIMPTAITGSYPRPLWFDASLHGRSFKAALGDSLFREQYLDAVAAVINAQEAAGLDIVTDGDSRFDLAVGGKSWFFYPIERLGGIHGHRSTSQGWMGRHGLQPGHILWEVQEAYQPAIVTEKWRRRASNTPPCGRSPSASATARSSSAQSAPRVWRACCWNQHYPDDKAMVLDLCDIINAELRDLAAAGCPVIQVEEPRHHGLTTRPDCTEADLEFQTEMFNRQLNRRRGRDLGAHLLGQPQPAAGLLGGAELRARPPASVAARRRRDHLRMRLRATAGALPLFAKYPTDKKIGIGVVNHCNTIVEPPEHVAGLIRKALEYIPPERLVITTDCGFGREGLSRRIAYYKCVSLVQGAGWCAANSAAEAHIRAADPKLYFASAGER